MSPPFETLRPKSPSRILGLGAPVGFEPERAPLCGMEVVRAARGECPFGPASASSCARRDDGSALRFPRLEHTRSTPRDPDGAISRAGCAGAAWQRTA